VHRLILIDFSTAIGAGNIRGMPFDIRINPKKTDNSDTTFSVMLTNQNNGLKAYIDKQLDHTSKSNSPPVAFSLTFSRCKNSDKLLPFALALSCVFLPSQEP
jgi:hypothetical protein